MDSQIGLEDSPQAYVDRLVEVFREVHRVLRDDGTAWLNLGDSYNSAGREGHGTRTGYKQGTTRASAAGVDSPRPDARDLKSKDLVGIPWRVALALQADGWYLRQDIIWSKSNPMPESVTDRCTKAHEYIFLLTKSARYYYDAVAIAEEGGSDYDDPAPTAKAFVQQHKLRALGAVSRSSTLGAASTVRNKRSIWTVASQPYAGAHFATFPAALIEPCILAGTSAKGCCPACGAPWRRVVERKAMVIRRSERTHVFGRTRSSGTVVKPADARTVGWYPSCGCDDMPELPGYPDEPNAGHDDELILYKRLCERVSAERIRLIDDAQYLFVVPAVVLDPFGGAGTTALAASRNNRSAVLIDLSADYCAMAAKRLRDDAPFLAHRVEYV